MNYLNRAIKNVTRKSSKTILLVATFFLIANLVVVGLGINAAAENAKNLTRNKMNPIVNYEIDDEKFMQEYQKLDNEERNNLVYPKLDSEILKKMLKDEDIDAATWNYQTTLYAQGFDPLHYEKMDNQGDASIDGSISMGGAVSSIGGGMSDKKPNLTLYGVGYPNMIEFKNKTYELTQGRMLNQEDIDNQSPICVIDERLAALNNWKIGDTVKIDLTDPDMLKDYEGLITPEMNTLEMEIVGLFKNNKEVNPNDPNVQWMGDAAHPWNAVLSPLSYVILKDMPVAQIKQDFQQKQMPDIKFEPVTEENYMPASVSMLLNNPLITDEFKARHESTINEFTRLDANDELFNKLAKPLDTISLFSNIIVWIVVLNAIVIITLVTALTMKNREYEIGVLLAMGVAKKKITAQLFIELLITAVLGFSLALVSGSLISKQIGNAVLAYQVTDQESSSDINNSFYFSSSNNYFTEITQEDMLSEYDVNIDPMIILQIYLLGIGVVGISILIPSLMIMRYNPKQILLSQN